MGVNALGVAVSNTRKRTAAVLEPKDASTVAYDEELKKIVKQLTKGGLKAKEAKLAAAVMLGGGADAGPSARKR